jgi:hypothetical protein
VYGRLDLLGAGGNIMRNEIHVTLKQEMQHGSIPFLDM